jgi:pimeloyl-ACP methyl ester carboxylesterase
LEGTEEIEGIIVSGYVSWMGRMSTPAHLLARLDSLERDIPVEPWPEPDTLSSGHGIGGYVADSIVFTRVVQPTNPRSYSEVLDSRNSMPPQKTLAGLKTPVLIISGDRGGRLSDGGGHLMRILPKAERVIIRDAAHDPWAADPDAFFGAVIDFLHDLGLT